MTQNYKTQVIRAHVLNELLGYIEDKRGSGTTLVMSLYDKRLAALRIFHIKSLERILSVRFRTSSQ